MRTVTFHAQGWEEFTAWQKDAPKIFARLTRLISETARDPFGGIGKPEPLNASPARILVAPPHR